MADKKITELQTVSSVTDGLYFPSDDTLQSYKATALQVFNYMKAKGWLETTQVKTTTYTVGNSDSMILANGTGGPFAVTLHTAVGFTGKKVQIMKTDAVTSGLITINTTSAQTIGGRASGAIKLIDQADYLEAVSDGTNWQIVKLKQSYALWVTVDSGITIPNGGGPEGGTVIFDDEVYDNGGFYDHTTGEITIPSPGLWGWQCSLHSDSTLNSSFHWELQANRDPGGDDEVLCKDRIAGNGSANTVNCVKISGARYFDAGDIVVMESAGIGQTLSLTGSPVNMMQFWKIS